MKVEDIKEGEIYLITGEYGCTSTKKCRTCHHFNGRVKVGFIRPGSLFVTGFSTLKGKEETHCTFNIENLMPLGWRDRFEGKR
jgi:hypothetical protein